MTGTMALKRRTFLKAGTGGVLAATLPVGLGAQAQPAQSTPVAAVLELFTSQGCSSCPPADALLQSYAERDDILALGYHIDYWDYLGWEDTLASAENTQRQHAYREALGNRSVYTPQVLVNGTHDMVGSHGDDIQSALTTSAKLPLSVSITKPDALHLGIAVSGSPEAAAEGPATVSIVYFSSFTTVPVRRGENAGRDLGYANAVRYFTTMGAWSGGDIAMKMPVSELAKKDADGCAILVQRVDGKGHPGAILGAAKFLAMTS